MPIIEFTEIPEPNVGSGKQDAFELFSRDLLDHLGYKVVSDPSRGPDGGVDIVVEETREGIAGETTIRWLASCKHFAHSGRSVGTSDETNIRDRVESHSCDGFMGVYSTLPSSALLQTFEGLKGHVEVIHYDSAKIEQALLSSPSGLFLAERYFPESIAKWKRENPPRARVLEGLTGLQCEYCGKDLLSEEEKSGIVVIWRISRGDDQVTSEEVYDIYWACKGNCDRSLHPRYDRNDAISGWEDIPDICIPSVYLKWVMSLVNQLYQGTHFSPQALEKYKTILLETFPYVSRDLTTRERRHIDILMRLPNGVGGFT